MSITRSFFSIVFLSAVVLVVFVGGGARAAIISVPGDHLSIQSAINAAQAGDTVSIEAGVYEERLLFKAGVTLEGSGRESCTVRAAAGIRPVLLVRECTTGSVKGLHFSSTHTRSFDGDLAYISPVVLMEDSTVDFQDCAISKGPGLGLQIVGATQATIKSCRIEHNAQGGVEVLGEGAAPHLLHNSIQHNTTFGVILNSGADALVEANLCSHHDLYGINIYGKATEGIVKKNRCLHNQCGIVVWKESDASVLENTCSENEKHGIYIVQPRTRPQVRNNTCCKNGLNGIFVDHRSGPLVEGNRCEANRSNGIRIRTKDAKMRVAANDCIANKNAGLHFLGGWEFKLGENNSQENGAVSEGELLHLVAEDDFDALESIVARSRKESVISSGGRWLQETFYIDLARYDYTWDRFQRKVEVIDAIFDRWMIAKPDSPTPHIARGVLYAGIVHDIRRKKDVERFSALPERSAAQWRELALASYQQAQALGATDVELYTRLITLGDAMGLESDHSLAQIEAGIKSDDPAQWTPLEKLFRKGLAICPLYDPLFHARLKTILPKYGDSNPLTRSFLEANVARTKEAWGEALYALIYYEIVKIRMRCYSMDNSWDEGFGPWERVEKALRDWRAIVDDPHRVSAVKAMLHCLREEKAMVETLFQETPEGYFHEWPWRDVHYSTYRKWVEGKNREPRWDREAATARAQAHNRFQDVRAPRWDWDLQNAIESNQLEKARVLLEAGKDPNIITPLGFVALNWLCSWERPEWVEYFLEQGADPNGSLDYAIGALMWAIEKDDSGMAKMLLNYGADINLAREDGLAPLHYAINKNKLMLVGLFVEYGAALEAKTTKGLSPLALAVEEKNLLAVKLLLSKGSDPNSIDGNGLPPLWYAVAAEEVDIIRLLLSKGADPTFVWGAEKSLKEFASEQEKATELLSLLQGNLQPGKTRPMGKGKGM